MHYTKQAALIQTLLILLVFMFTPALIAAETNSYNRVSYQVTEQQEVTNDEITVTVGVERNNQDAPKLANEINQLITSANATIKKFPSIKSSTSDYSIRPVYSRDQQLDHWRGVSSITLKSQRIKDMEALVQILQKTLLVKSTRYNVSAERKEEIETGMIKDALKKFNIRAKMISKDMGFKKYRLVNININNSSNTPRPIYAMARSKTVSADITPPSFESGQSILKVTVSGTIEMEVTP
ncbi:MAG: SIMPL domain-containing protein [Gammaproteobacteria bacterium]|nr:SIMPL domain-containing protein [Gammaproteobacteria bacterium]